MEAFHQSISVSLSHTVKFATAFFVKPTQLPTQEPKNKIMIKVLYSSFPISSVFLLIKVPSPCCHPPVSGGCITIMAASTWAPFTRLGLGLGLGLRLRLGAPFRRHMLSHTAYRYPVDLRSASRADCLRDRDMYCDTTQRLLSTFPSFPSLPKTLELDRQQETKRGQIQLILGPMFSGSVSVSHLAVRSRFLLTAEPLLRIM